jgi:hypothetical protein
MLPSRCLLISFKIVHSLNHLCFSTPYPKPLHPPKHNIPSINLAHYHHHGHPNRHRPCLRHGIPIRCPQPRRQSHRCKSYPTLIHSQPSPIPISHPPPISHLTHTDQRRHPRRRQRRRRQKHWRPRQSDRKAVWTRDHYDDKGRQ